VKPYYDDGTVTIYHGDCREIVPRLPVPVAVFTDPPYGIAYRAVRDRDIENRDIASDENFIAAQAVLEPVLRATSGATAHFVCCDWRSLPMASDKLRTVQNLDRFAKRHEFILYAGPYGGEATVSSDIWPVARDFDPDHPTPKPVKLVSRAVQASTNWGDVILDPFMGSGSTLQAAKALGRRAIGIEIEERYCEVAAQPVRPGRARLRGGGMKRILHALAGAAGWALGLAADVLFGPCGEEYVSRTNGPVEAVAAA
jgi:DNA modification methylase